MTRKYKVENIEVYTDGSCRKYNPKDSKGIAGWGYVILVGGELIRWETGVLLNSTNNRGEITAVIKGLEAAQKLPEYDRQRRIIVYSDSAYVVNALNDWIPNSWIPKNWINSQKKEILNRDLWLQLVPYTEKFGFSFVKVPGHSDNTWNNFIDEKVQTATAEAKLRGIKND